MEILRALDDIITIDGYGETNPHANPSKACNGGGYHQPEITGWVGATPFSLLDHDCGDFGRTTYLTLGKGRGARHFICSNMDGQPTYMPDRIGDIMAAIFRVARKGKHNHNI